MDIYTPPIPERMQGNNCLLGAGLSISNELSVSSGDWGTIVIDTEGTKISVLTQAKTDIGDFGVQVPFRVYYGGFLDTLLNPIHQVLNQPYSVVPNKNFIYLGRADFSIISIDSSIFGLGDPTISWVVNGIGNFRLGTSLSLPVGKHEKLMGTGGLRLAIFFEYAESDMLDITSQIVIPLEKQKAYENLEQKAWGLMIKLWLGLPDRSGGIAINLATSPIGLGGSFSETSIALSYELNNFTFSEDLSANHPDVSFTWENTWPCNEISAFW